MYGRGDGEVDGEVEFLLVHGVSSRVRVCPRRSNYTPLAQRPDRFRTPSQSWPPPRRLFACPRQGGKQLLQLEEQVGPCSELWAPGYRPMQLAVALTAAVLSGKLQKRMYSTRRAAALDGGSGSGLRSCGSCRDLWCGVVRSGSWVGWFTGIVNICISGEALWGPRAEPRAEIGFSGAHHQNLEIQAPSSSGKMPFIDIYLLAVAPWE